MEYINSLIFLVALGGVMIGYALALIVDLFKNRSNNEF